MRHGGVGLEVIPPDRMTRVVVWGTLLVMMVAALVCIAYYGKNIPFNEDWDLVPALTGNQPDLAKWLWAQHDETEHRVPLAKLILLALLKITNCDFRAGMYFNVITLGILAFFMIHAARRLRGGRTISADAFFPIALLHLGNWENLFWGWQFSFVMPAAVTCAVFLMIVICPTLLTPWVAVFAGACLMSLPLCGANGLLFVPLVALWFGYCGVLSWYGRERWVGRFLVGSAVVALCLTALYFVGYEQATWYPRLGLGETLVATAKFLAMSFGPAAGKSWKLSVLITVGFLSVSAIVAVFGLVRSRGLERQRALGILLFAINLAIFALALGWGRAGLFERSKQFPTRYVLLAAPVLVVSFFVWELYGPKRLRAIVQTSLLLGMIVLLPFNTKAGLKECRYYLKEMNSVQNDLLEGVPRSMLAQRHGAFLQAWDVNGLSNGMQMLHDAGIGPFARMREDPPGARIVLKNFRERK